MTETMTQVAGTTWSYRGWLISLNGSSTMLTAEGPNGEIFDVMRQRRPLTADLDGVVSRIDREGN